MNTPSQPQHSLHELESHLIERLRRADPALYKRLLSAVQDALPTPTMPKTFQTLSDIRAICYALRRRFTLPERIELIRRLLEPD